MEKGSATFNSVVHCSWFKQLLQALQNWQLRLPQTAKRKTYEGRKKGREEAARRRRRKTNTKLHRPHNILLIYLPTYLLLLQAMLLLPMTASAPAPVTVPALVLAPVRRRCSRLWSLYMANHMTGIRAIPTMAPSLPPMATSSL